MDVARPVVGIICDYRRIDEQPFHIAGEKYIAALRDGSNAIPLLIPALDPPLAPEDILASVDGLMFPARRRTSRPATTAESRRVNPSSWMNSVMPTRFLCSEAPFKRANLYCASAADFRN